MFRRKVRQEVNQPAPAARFLEPGRVFQLGVDRVRLQILEGLNYALEPAKRFERATPEAIESSYKFFMAILSRYEADAQDKCYPEHLIRYVKGVAGGALSFSLRLIEKIETKCNALPDDDTMVIKAKAIVDECKRLLYDDSPKSLLAASNSKFTNDQALNIFESLFHAYLVLINPTTKRTERLYNHAVSNPFGRSSLFAELASLLVALAGVAAIVVGALAALPTAGISVGLMIGGGCLFAAGGAMMVQCQTDRSLARLEVDLAGRGSGRIFAF